MGYWAETDCCPLVAGFKFEKASGEVVCSGSCPDSPEEQDQSIWDDFLSGPACWFGGCDPPPFRYMHTDWKDAPGDLIGFGGRSGGAIDQIFLIFNTCGPTVVLSGKRDDLNHKSNAVNALEASRSDLDILTTDVSN